MTQEEMQQVIENMQREFQKKMSEMENKLNSLTADVNIINKFVSAMTEAQDLAQTMGEIESVTKQLTNCDNATFYCYDSSNDKFFNDGDYRSWQSEQSADELKDAFDSKEILSDGKQAVIPLVSAGGNSLGVIVADKAKGFTPDDYKNFHPGCQIAGTVELAMKKESEHQGRITDELTHLKNRQGLNEYLANTMCNNLANGNTVNIIMCDIDHFKSVNDTYGHDAGDTILKNVAAVLNEGTRTGADCAFRMGGEEMVCIVNSSPEEALDVAERLRTAVENTVHNVMQNGEPTDVKVTVSMGIHTMNPQEQVTPENARHIFDDEFKHADNAVYEAKESGRNKVVSSDKDTQLNYIAGKVSDIIADNADKQAVKESIAAACKSGDYESVVQAVQEQTESNPDIADKADAAIAMIDKFKAIPKQEEPEKNKEENILDVAAAATPNLLVYVEQNSFSEHLKTDRPLQDILSCCEEKAPFRAIADMASEKLSEADFAYENQSKNTLAVEINIDENTLKAYNNDFYASMPLDKAISDMNKEFPKRNMEEAKKAPTFYNKSNYKNIDNKTFISTDAKTAFNISKAAEKAGIEFSAKFDGPRSAVTVDGIKNKSFVDTVKSMEKWADKIQVRAFEKSKEIEQKQKNNTERS